MRQIRSGCGVLVALLMAVAALPGQGIATKSSAVILFGSTSNTTNPSSIKMDDVEKETPEHDTIRSEGVRKGSARYELLMAKMHDRVVRAAKAAAEAAGHDCVVRHGDVTDARGLQVVDVTKAVVNQLALEEDRK